MPGAKVGLSKLLALTEEFDGSVVIAQFLMLITHTQMRHYLDRDEVIELEIEALKFLISSICAFRALILDFFA